MLEVKLRKSIGTLECELVKVGKKYNTYKMSFWDFDDAVKELMLTHDAEIDVTWLGGVERYAVPQKMRFIHPVATSVKVVCLNSGQTLLKWSEK